VTPNPQRLDQLTVAELRQMARERGIKRYSKMKKADLVSTLQRTEDQVPADEMSETSPATTPSAEAFAPSADVPTTDVPVSDQPWTGSTGSWAAAQQRADEGQRTTSDHEEIRAWADARNASPATERGAAAGTPIRVLRFRFSHTPPEHVEPIDWTSWFQTFDSLRLRFVYVEPADGSRTDEFQLEPR
jgi:hypothetical protein